MVLEDKGEERAAICWTMCSTYPSKDWLEGGLRKKSLGAYNGMNQDAKGWISLQNTQNIDMKCETSHERQCTKI